MSRSLKKQASLREAILVLAGLAAICYLGFSIFYEPAKARVRDFSEKTAKVEEEIAGVAKLVEALQKKQVEEKEGAQTPVLKNSRAQLIKGYKEGAARNVSDFLNVITQPRFKSGLSIDSLDYGALVENKGFTACEFHLVVHGAFDRILEFIQRLEDVPALVSLDSIDIHISKTDVNLVSLDLSGTYYQLEDQNG